MPDERLLSLGRRPAARLLDLFLQRGEADGESALGQPMRVLHLAWSEIPLGIPIELGPIALGPALEEPDPVLEHCRVGWVRPSLPRGRLEERRRAAEQVGLGDRVLQYQPGSLCTVRADEVCPRPSDGLDHPPKTLRTGPERTLTGDEGQVLPLQLQKSEDCHCLGGRVALAASDQLTGCDLRHRAAAVRGGSRGAAADELRGDAAASGVRPDTLEAERGSISVWSA